MILADPAELVAAFRAGLQPDPPITVSEWSDRHRVLESSTSAEPGPWRTSRAPYLREIMDRMSTSDPCRRVTFVKCSQVGGSEAGNNAIGYYIDHAPSPILMVQPREDDAKTYSKQRLAKMIASTPTLKSKVKPSRSRDSGNTLQLKEFPGGIFRICGANSPANLASMPMRIVIFDEVDRFPMSSGTEGDPIELGEKRQSTFANAKTLEISTPTSKRDSRIVASFEQSDRRRYVVPCPSCGEGQVLSWDKLHGDCDEKGAVIPSSVWYECAANGCVIEERSKPTMLAAGQWRPTTVNEDGSMTFGDAAEVSSHYGYHINGLYSPLGWVSWLDLVAEYYRAKDDPVRLRVFVNTRLGEVWDDEDGERLDGDGLAARVETFAAPCPSGVAVITAGIDVQKDRIECEVTGWGVGLESWSLDYIVMTGDPEMPDIWTDLDRYLIRKWRREDGGELGISAAAIDTGYLAHRVYAFCAPRWHRNIWAIKGKHGGDREVWPTGWSRAGGKSRCKLKIVGVDRAKDHVYERLTVEAPGAGYCHVPADRELWWFRQLTSERRKIVTRHGRRSRVWVLPDGTRNEALDCRVYSYAAILGWESGGRSIAVAAATVKATAQDNAAASKPAPRKRRGTLTRRKLFR